MSEWRPIDTAPRNDDEPILASTNGKVWFQCTWDDDDGWVTFNRYLEEDRRLPGAPRAFNPTVWVPLPLEPAQRPNPASDGMS